MNHENEHRDADLIDLGIASVETRGGNVGIPEEKGKILSGGISNE